MMIRYDIESYFLSQRFDYFWYFRIPHDTIRFDTQYFLHHIYWYIYQINQQKKKKIDFYWE